MCRKLTTAKKKITRELKKTKNHERIKELKEIKNLINKQIEKEKKSATKKKDRRVPPHSVKRKKNPKKKQNVRHFYDAHFSLLNLSRFPAHKKLTP